MKKTIILILALILLSTSLVCSAPCSIKGTVFYSDGTPVPSGIDVTVTNLETGETISTKTGQGFPPDAQFADQYKISFDCKVGSHYARSLASTDSFYGESQVLTTATVTYSDVILNQQIPSDIKQAMPKQTALPPGGAGGGASLSLSAYLDRKLKESQQIGLGINYILDEALMKGPGHNILLTKDDNISYYTGNIIEGMVKETFVLSRVLADSISFKLIPSGKEISIILGQHTLIEDLNGDISIILNSITDNFDLTFTRIIKADEEAIAIMQKQPDTDLPEDVIMSPSTPTSHLILNSTGLTLIMAGLIITLAVANYWFYKNRHK